jgi:uncharacterized protein (DUF362 family)
VHGSARELHRRDFLKTAALGVAALPLVDLERLGGLVPNARQSRVALVRTADRSHGVAETLRLLKPAGIKGKRVVIKPNFNTADDAPGSTHNDTLAQLVRELQEREARSITVGESSGPPLTRNVMETKGIFDLAKDQRFEVVDFEQLADMDWVGFTPPGSHWVDGFHLPRLVVDSEYMVSTCCLKTHGGGGVFTMSLKLAVGLTPKPIRRGMHRSPDMRRMVAELNTGYKPKLIVLDGVAAFTNGGPSRGELNQANVMIAGDDRVAVDAVGIAVLKQLGSNEAIMSRRIFEQEQIARAVELGLGVGGPADIELVTGDAESQAYAAKLRPILDLG